METKVKKDKKQRLTVCLGLLFLCTHFSVLMTQELISFDVKHATTWYEKGLNSVLFVWNKAFLGADAKQDKRVAVTDVLLGRLAYAQFCLEKMHQEKQFVIDEDILYFHIVLKTIGYALVDDTQLYSNDHLQCLLFIVDAIKNRLVLFYPKVITP